MVVLHLFFLFFCRGTRECSVEVLGGRAEKGALLWASREGGPAEGKEKTEGSAYVVWNILGL